MLKTWILIFLVVCIAVEIGVGIFVSFLEGSAKEPLPEEPIPGEIADEPEEGYPCSMPSALKLTT